ncbi:M23 family metallopeptidase [Fulvivirgaceae bacterium BMA10]|uniref:M23 family metallopeptidase n=1 Tax=Splendidivirga corallicola TaxID=3051826 RepID=A0ABT8KVU6_9BACT|nr:M23 family metallopeptidase [Fulvivirgaceae bacterium BMA10]
MIKKQPLVFVIIFLAGTFTVFQLKGQKRLNPDKALAQKLSKSGEDKYVSAESDFLSHHNEAWLNLARASEQSTPDTFSIDIRRDLLAIYGEEGVFDRKPLSLYNVSEELAVGGDWIESHDYYMIWDSKKVNPYKFDGAKLKDTIDITLEDHIAGYQWMVPITETKINSAFGFRRYRWHYGIDLKLNRGDTVRATADGVVRMAQYDRWGYGHYVVLRHKNGLETLYGHFTRRLVRVGQEVKAGTPIGLGGSTGRSTGNHLHFEVRYKGHAVNPIEIFDFEKDSLLRTTYELTPKSFEYIKEASKRIYHRIRRGDTLSRISRRYGVSINTLCRLNGIRRSTILRIGRRLRVRG